MTDNGQLNPRTTARELIVGSPMHNDACEVMPGDVWFVTGNELKWKYYVVVLRKQPGGVWSEDMWQCRAFAAPGNEVNWDMSDVQAWKLPRPDWASDQGQLVCRGR